MKLHPAERFSGPGSMARGGQLRELIGRECVTLIAEAIGDVYGGFDRKGFVRRAVGGLEGKELKQRAEFVGDVLGEFLPGDFGGSSKILIDSFGPELSATEGNGLKVFFYFPHACFIAKHGVGRFEEGMRANYELTKRFTAEFSVRPFIARYPEKALKVLMRWTKDANPHVRRLVSEGSRPRLPWAMRLKAVQENPQLTLPLLEKLKDDPELYVRRSVANHLGDILKDHPEVGYGVCERWVEEIRGGELDQGLCKARCWLVSHAVRMPAKKGEKRAVKIRERVGGLGD